MRNSKEFNIIDQTIRFHGKQERKKGYNQGVRIGSLYTFVFMFPIFGILHAFSHFEFLGGLLVSTIVFAIVAVVFYSLKE